jgi:mersacidin/lichenicidin family type 2 lantibiotic
MSISKIIRAWKAEDDEDEDAPTNPAGEYGLSDEELAYIDGGGIGGNNPTPASNCYVCPPLVTLTES